MTQSPKASLGPRHGGEIWGPGHSACTGVPRRQNVPTASMCTARAPVDGGDYRRHAKGLTPRSERSSWSLFITHTGHPSLPCHTDEKRGGVFPRPQQVAVLDSASRSRGQGPTGNPTTSLSREQQLCVDLASLTDE